MMSVPNLLDLSYDASMQMESKKLPPLRVPTKDIKIQKTNPLNPRKCEALDCANSDETLMMI